jgi:transcription antitermination factor NusG
VGGENGGASGAYTPPVPLLPREADHFPEGVFRLPLSDFPWGVAHVKSRTEKALARHLTGLRVPFYLPLWERRMRRSGRNFVSYNPFFAGYVFLRGSVTSRAQALRSNLIVRLLDVPDQALLDAELCQLRALQEAGTPLIPFPWLGPGDAVRIEEGPFKGYLGVIVREKGAQRLVVSVSMLRRSVAVELERESLAPNPGLPGQAGRSSRG